MIKNHEYDKFQKYLKNNPDVDINIIDENNNYLINYIINYNKVDLLSILILKKVKLNIISTDGYSIFYNPIKYGFYDIIKLLLYFNDTNNINLLNLIDNYNKIPLHYAIQFKRNNIIKEMLKYQFNLNHVDKNNNNALNIALISKNTEAAYLLINENININQINNKGETAIFESLKNKFDDISLKLIENNCDLKIKNNKFQLTPLLLSVYLNNITISKKIYEKQKDCNEQDNFGNCILHYCITYDFMELYNFFIDKISYDLFNLNGLNALSYLLELNKTYDKYKIDLLLNKSNINYQDNKGNTILFKLLELNLFIKYQDILKKKKIKNFHN